MGRALKDWRLITAICLLVAIWDLTSALKAFLFGAAWALVASLLRERANTQ